MSLCDLLVMFGRQLRACGQLGALAYIPDSRLQQLLLVCVCVCAHACVCVCVCVCAHNHNMKLITPKCRVCGIPEQKNS